MDYNIPHFPVLDYLPEFAQTHAHWVSDAIEPFHLLPSYFAFILSQNQGLFQWVSSLHQVAKVLQVELQHLSFQWIFRVDFLWNWIVWSSCSPRNSQEYSPLPHEGINSLALSLFYGQALTAIHDWKKTIALTMWILVGKVMSLLLNTLSRFAIVFLPRSKYLLIS